MTAIRVGGLTASQSNAVATVLRAADEKLVTDAGSTYVVLNDTPADCLPRIQKVMDDIREAKGGRSAYYRALVPLRNKVEEATKGKTKDVTIMPNGANVTGEVPAVMAGAPIDPAARRGRGRRPVVTTTRADDTASVKDHVSEAPAPAGTELAAEVAQAYRLNWEAARRSAPSDNARRFWTRKLETLPTT